MVSGVVKQSSTSSCCSALSWSGSESSASGMGPGHAHGHSPGDRSPDTPSHSGSLPYLPPPSYEKALLEAQQSQADEDAGYETLQQRSSSPSPPPPSASGSRVQAVQEAPAQGPVILHKSSKALYRAVAAQWGITCKMNDHCRCLDCQSHYFDCDYDLNEEGKTDGGLGAGSPIFLQEVMHGTACYIL